MISKEFKRKLVKIYGSKNVSIRKRAAGRLYRCLETIVTVQADNLTMQQRMRIQDIVTMIFEETKKEFGEWCWDLSLKIKDGNGYTVPRR
jgi:hypothetical protein